MNAPIATPGLRIYCDSHDVTRPDRTIALALRAGAVGVIAMVEGIVPDRGSRRLPVSVVRRFVEAAHASDLSVTVCAFPDVREAHGTSIAHLLDCAGEGADATELDAEPRAGARWTAAKLRPWLDAGIGSITTTRHEAPRLGKHGLRLRGQLEQLDSTDTLASALAKLGKGAAVVEPVIGAFDQRGIVRTPEHIARDLERCTAQARSAGGLAVWSAHTLDDEEADVLRGWALGVWRVAA